jgi:hypothetical protein
MPVVPRKIVATEFDDPLPEDLNSNIFLSVGRSAFGLWKRNVTNVPACGVEELSASNGTAATTASFTQSDVHGELAPDAAQRVSFTPGVVAANVTWKMKGHAQVTKLELELFVAGKQAPLWKCAIAYDGGQCPESTTIALNGSLATDAPPVVAGAKTVTVTSVATTVDFPGGQLTQAKGPYKLRLSIPQSDTLTRAPPARFVYLDVVANVVTPHLEAEYLVAILDRKLGDHHKASGDAPVLSPTRIEVALTQDRPEIHKYTKGGKLTRSNANVSVYTDEACTTELAFSGNDAALTHDQLTQSPRLSLYLRGKTAGRFDLTLTLDPETDPRIVLDAPAKREMGVVTLALDVYRYDVAGKPPTLKAMSDADRVGESRIVHAQDSENNHGRAKLVLRKLVAAEWPPGCGAYKLRLVATSTTGAVEVFDAETDGAKKTLPLAEHTQADVVAAEKVLWLEGKTETDALRDVRLDLGLDRDAGGIAKVEKRNGDVATFTVVKIEKVAPSDQFDTPSTEYTGDTHKVYVNLKNDPDGRKLTLKAKLTKALAGIRLGFSLLPEKGNGKAANYGADLPGTWVYNSIADTVKHAPKDGDAARKDFIVATNDQGVAEKEVTLSRFGGDVFWGAAWIDDDPLLADFVDGDTVKGKRKPVSSKKLHVWRKIWFQMTYAQGFNPPVPDAAIAAYKKVKAEFVQAAAGPVRYDASATPPGTWYPEWMVKQGGGNQNVSVVGDHNKAHFFGMLATVADEPCKAHLVICEHQWDPNTTALKTVDITTNPSAEIVFSKHVLKPTLKNVPLVIEAKYLVPPSTWVDLTDADILVENTRTSINAVKVKLPDTAPVPTATAPVKVKIKLHAGDDFLGESVGTRILIVYNSADVPDYNDTVTHEVGHAIHQTGESTPVAGIPPHPNAVNASNQGTHCRNGNKKCVMYDSGPQATAIHEYCEVCHPYLIVENMKL